MKKTTRRRLIRGLAATGLGALAAGWVAITPRRTNAYYQGPKSDHFDGLRFYNPGGDNPRSFLELARFMFLEPSETWPASFPSPFADEPPARLAGPEVRVAFVGHASFLLQTNGLNILLDPVWAERASPLSFLGPRRVNPPGIAFGKLPPIDVVLVTHNHYDHLDLATLERLEATFRPHFVTPLGNDTIMRERIGGARITVGDWNHEVWLSEKVRVHFEPTQHWSARGTRDRRHALWASFVVETGPRKIYAVGDSGLGDGRTFRRVAGRHPRIDLALLPIGAFEPRWFMASQHMNPADAVVALKLSGAARALGHHWGTFKLTNEGIEAPPRALATALLAGGVQPELFRALRPGEVDLLR